MKNMLLSSALLIVILGFNRSNVMANSNKINAVQIQLDTLPPDSLVNGLPIEIDNFINNEVTFKVPVITCQQLLEIQVNEREQMAILDARSQREFNFSHIKNARRVGYEDFTQERIWFYEKNTIVVIYSNEGEKSEKIALKLLEMGFKDIRNLYGGITEWSSQNLPLVNKAGRRTFKKEGAIGKAPKSKK